MLRNRFIALIGFAATLAFSSHALAAPPSVVFFGGGHEDVSALDVSQDEQYLATASFGDSTVKLWRIADGQLVRTFAGHTSGVHSVKFSPDGQSLLSGGEFVFGGGNTALILWHVADGSIVKQFDTGSQSVNAVAFSPDGAKVAAGLASSATRVFGAGSGQLLYTAAGGTFQAFSVAFSHDGARLAVSYGNDHTIKLFNATNGVLQKTLTGHTFFVMGVAFSPDDQTLASCSWDQTARLWNASSGALVKTISANADALYGIDFAPDGQSIAVACLDGTVRRYHVPDGALLSTFGTSGLEGPNCVRIAHDGQSLWTGSANAHAWRFAIPSGAVTSTIGHHEAAIVGVAVSADATMIATSSRDQTIRLWDAASGADLKKLVGPTDSVNAVAFDWNGSRLASAAGSPPPDTKDPTVKIWNTATGAVLFTLPGHVGGSFGVSWSPVAGVDRVASGGNDKNVKIWNAATGSLVTTLTGHTNAVRGVAYSPNGGFIASASYDGTVRVWDAQTFALLKTLVAPGGSALTSVAWSPDGTRVAAGAAQYGDNVHVWSVATGQVIATFSDPNGFVQSVGFSPDGANVASGSGYSREVRVFALASGQLVDDFTSETGWGSDVNLPLTYSPDGRLVFGRTDATLVVAGCKSAASAYGSGCPGSGGAIPSLAWSGCATPQAPVALSVTTGLGGAPTLLFFGTAQSAISLPGGCVLRVFPVLPTPLAFTLSGTGSGSGSIVLAGAIPAGAPAGSFAAQAFVIDPGVPSGFAATNGIGVTIAP